MTIGPAEDVADWEATHRYAVREAKGLAEPALPDGVWVTYYWDQTLVIETVWADEICALRAVNDGSGFYKAGFLPYGAEAREALA